MTSIKILGLILLTHWTTSLFANEINYPLKFNKGRLSTVTEACIQPNDRHHYPLVAKAGQAISIALTANTNAVMFRLAYKNPAQQWQFLLLDKDYSSNAWFGTLPNSHQGHYLIQIEQVRDSSCYEMFVGIGGN